jgi:ubiquinone/menaquinone biosynthesis C-methylase UbiE
MSGNPQSTQDNLARSLTAQTTDLLPYLPYLLQDLWALGSDPKEISRLLAKHLPISENTKILDLACGKGAVSVGAARALRVKVHGIDLMPDFVAFASEKAAEFGVDSLCYFSVGDANTAVNTERDYDCVIFCSAGNIRGNPDETIRKLIKTITPNGLIIIVDAYLNDGSGSGDVKFAYEYLTRKEWLKLFDEAGLAPLEETSLVEEYDYDADTKAISMRAEELSAQYPDKKNLFAGYVDAQLAECDDLYNNITAVTWVLRKL